MKERFLNVDAFIFDINMYDEKVINSFVNQYFDILSPKIDMSLKFEYSKTPNGYCYKIIRHDSYQLRGNHIKDFDCALITEFALQDFQTSQILPNSNAKARCIIPWSDGCYVPEQELEEIYKRMINVNGEVPKSVEIHAYDDSLSVNVEYDTTNVSNIGNSDNTDVSKA